MSAILITTDFDHFSLTTTLTSLMPICNYGKYNRIFVEPNWTLLHISNYLKRSHLPRHFIFIIIV